MIARGRENALKVATVLAIKSGQDLIARLLSLGSLNKQCLTLARITLSRFQLDLHTSLQSMRLNAKRFSTMNPTCDDSIIGGHPLEPREVVFGCPLAQAMLSMNLAIPFLEVMGAMVALEAAEQAVEQAVGAVGIKAIMGAKALTLEVEVAQRKMQTKKSTWARLPCMDPTESFAL